MASWASRGEAGILLNINAWLDVANVHWLYKVHIFLGLLITILFPFTRLVHMVSGFDSYMHQAWRLKKDESSSAGGGGGKQV